MQMRSIYSISKAVALELKQKGQAKLWRALETPKSKACFSQRAFTGLAAVLRRSDSRL